MKLAPIIAIAFGAMFALPMSAAQAVDPGMPAARHLYGCRHGGLSRVADAAQSTPCCTAMLGCPRLLATTGFAKPKQLDRT